jgi:hypothetical protein
MHSASRSSGGSVAKEIRHWRRLCSGIQDREDWLASKNQTAKALRQGKNQLLRLPPDVTGNKKNQLLRLYSAHWDSREKTKSCWLKRSTSGQNQRWTGQRDTTDQHRDSIQSDHRNAEQRNDGKNESGKRILLQVAEKMKFRRERFVLLRGDGEPSGGPTEFRDGEAKNRKWAAARTNQNNRPPIQIKPNSKEGHTTHDKQKLVFIVKQQKYNWSMELIIISPSFNYWNEN